MSSRSAMRSIASSGRKLWFVHEVAATVIGARTPGPHAVRKRPIAERSPRLPSSPVPKNAYWYSVPGVRPSTGACV